MRALPLLWAVLAFGGCAGAEPSTSSPPAPGERPGRSPVRTAVGPTPAAQPDTGAVQAAEQDGPADAGTATPGRITDEECLARGGHIETEQTYAHEGLRRPGVPLQPYRVCRIPSPANGNDCRDDADCAGGRCFCQGELSGPNAADRHPALRALDGTPATGRCSDERLPSGAWYCLVEGGRVVLSGIIID